MHTSQAFRIQGKTFHVYMSVLIWVSGRKICLFLESVFSMLFAGIECGLN